MTERKFTSKLNCKGMAAVLRNEMSSALREASILVSARKLLLIVILSDISPIDQ